MSDAVEILIHGPSCRHWVDPEKTSDYVVLALVEEPRKNGSDWVCPSCGAVVLEFYDYGEIEFGF